MMTAPGADRHQVILELIGARGRVSIGDISYRLQVSEMTVRRDLSALEAEGLLRRVHGGAVAVVSGSYEPPFALRARTNSEEKRAIGRAVVGCLRPGETVVLDGGSTGVAIAEALVAAAELTVCTPSLRVAGVLGSAPGIRLMVTGGIARAGELSLVGDAALRTLADHRFDTFVMTVSGVHAEAGLTEWNLDDAAVKKQAVASAQRCIVACDASKLGKIAFARVCALDQADFIVTDRRADSDEQRVLAAGGAEVHIA